MPENNNIVNHWTRADWETVQQRAVNPYRAVEARAVNRLTRVVTRGDNVSLGENKIEFIDYKTIRIKANKYVKDDVYVEFLEDIDLDLTDNSNYYSESYKGLNSEGIYWISIVYTFVNSIPYPYATFKIIKRREDITDEVLVIGRLVVLEDIEVPGGYAIDEESIEGDETAVLHVDALRKDLLHAIATRTAVNYRDEELIFTHDDPNTKTSISELDAQVQSMQHDVNRLENEVLSVEENTKAATYKDLYGPGMPLEDLADYEPKQEIEPDPEPEPGDSFDVDLVYLNSDILDVSFNEAIEIHDDEMENGVVFVASLEDHTVVGYPDSYRAENGDLEITADFSDTGKYIMIKAGLLETRIKGTVQEDDIVFSLEEYVNDSDGGNDGI